MNRESETMVCVGIGLTEVLGVEKQGLKTSKLLCPLILYCLSRSEVTNELPASLGVEVEV